MYGLPASLLFANPLDRYLINSPMLPQFKRMPTAGSRCTSRTSPRRRQGSNWLPAPKGPFLMAMRLYWPKPERSSGKWKAPPLQRMS